MHHRKVTNIYMNVCMTKVDSGVSDLQKRYMVIETAVSDIHIERKSLEGHSTVSDDSFNERDYVHSI